MEDFDANLDHIALNTGELGVPFRAEPEAPITIIAAGLTLSGVRLITAILRLSGIAVEDDSAEFIFEDERQDEALRRQDRAIMRQFIKERNAAETRWAFAHPRLCDHGDLFDAADFRNPRLIVICRDPAAIALDSDLEPADAMHAREFVERYIADHAMLIKTVLRVDCPVLLLSYEKCLSNPGKCVEALIDFCGLRIPYPVRLEMARLIAPDATLPNPAEAWHPEGQVDEIRDNRLTGWFRFAGVRHHPELELRVDGIAVARTVASEYRADLVAAGRGTGDHGFHFSLHHLALRQGSRLQVFALDSQREIFRSGMTAAEYGFTGAIRPVANGLGLGAAAALLG